MSAVAGVDSVVCPCLWVGTSLGSVLVVAFGMPVDGARNTEPVSVMPTGTLNTSLLIVFVVLISLQQEIN